MPGILQRLALLVMTLTAVASSAQAGPVSQHEWSKLSIAISNERWSDAVTMSLGFLDRVPVSDEIERGRLRYMFLLALSGEVISGDLTYDDFSARVAPLIGQSIVLPGHPVADAAIGGPMFNQIAATDDAHSVRIIAANADATSIHFFEYARLIDPIDLDAHESEIGHVRGTLKSIQPNPNSADTWVARLHLDDAVISFASR